MLHLDLLCAVVQGTLDTLEAEFSRLQSLTEEMTLSGDALHEWEAQSERVNRAQAAFDEAVGAYLEAMTGGSALRN
jgi:hypothetical protein